MNQYQDRSNKSPVRLGNPPSAPLNSRGNNMNSKKRNSYSELSRSRSKERLSGMQSRTPSYALRKKNLEKYTPKISRIDIPDPTRGRGQENFLGYRGEESRTRLNFPRFRSEDERSPEKQSGDKSVDTKTKRKAKLIYSRFDEFMKNLELKRYQAAAAAHDSGLGYGTNDEEADEPINEKSLQTLNAPLQEYIQKNSAVTFGKGQQLGESPKRSVSPIRDEARRGSFLYKEHNPVSSDGGSSSRSFRRDPKKDRFLTEVNNTSVLETKTMINVEIEVEFLKLKKEGIILEDKLNSKEREVEGLKMLLEEANREILKIHQAREKGFEKIKQLENDILQQKRINKNLEQSLNSATNGENFENPLLGESYQIVRILKQDRALLRKRLEQYEIELEEQKQHNQILLKDFNEILLRKNQKQDFEILVSKYMGEIESLRNTHQKGNRRLEEFLNELEEREVLFERDLEEERKKVSDVLKEVEKITQEKIAAEVTVQNMQDEQKKRLELFKAQSEKINDVLNELARENKNYRGQIKILAADRPLKEKLDALESNYNKLSKALLKEKEEIRKGSEGKSDNPFKEEEAPRYIVRKNSEGEKEAKVSSKKSAEEDRASKEEIARLGKQLEDVQNNLSGLIKKRDELNEENGKLKEKIKSLESDKKSLKTDLEKIKAKTIGAIGEYEEKLAKAVENIEKLKGENDLLKTNKGSATLINELKHQNEKLKGEINNLELQLKDKFNDMQQLSLEVEERINSMNDQLKQITAQKEKLEEKLEENAKLSKEEIEKKQKEILQLEQQLKEIDEKYKALMELYSKEDDIRGDLNRYKTIVERQKEMIEKVREESKEFEDLVKESGEKLEELDNQKGEALKKTREQEEIIQAYEKQIDMWSMQLAEATSREQDLLKQIKNLKDKLPK